MSIPERFDTNGLDLWSLADTFLVRCPKCEQQARVTRLSGDQRRMAKVSCVHCGFARSQAFDEVQWKGPVAVMAHIRCHYCGRNLYYTRGVAHVPQAREITLRCSGCEHSTTVSPHVSNIDSSQPFDWYFGLPLWLQTPCCGKTLWAINERHLQFLKVYVHASLREGVLNYNHSLASRLPRWIKQREHRAEVGRCIQRLWDLLQK